MKVKERISHYNSQPSRLIHDSKIICERVKQKLDAKQVKIRKTKQIREKISGKRNLSSKRNTSNKQDTKDININKENNSGKKNQNHFKIPKKNKIFHKEAAYAATPKRVESEIIRREIQKEANEFREINYNTSKKERRTTSVN